jgi:hypothetical protein
MSTEIYLMLQICFHFLIWLFILVGGIYSSTIRKFSIYIFLPLTYIIQSFPLHILIRQKILYIIKHKNELSPIPQSFHQKYKLIDEEKKYILQISNRLQISEEKTTYAYLLLRFYEYRLKLPYLFLKLWKHFEPITFANPFSPQGFIIIGFIINTILSI